MRARSFFKTVLAASFLFLTAGPAKAAPGLPAPNFSGTELLKMCNSTYDTDYGFCGGYVSAIANMMIAESVAEYRACRHEQVRSQQAIDIFRSYAEIFPEMLDGEASAAVAASLARAFPCPD